MGKIKSKGEERIAEILSKNGILYRREYKIKECAFKKPLPFDFAVFDFSGNLLYLIECDGIQHIQKVAFFEKKNSKSSVQWRDFLKNKYCLTHGIPLIRIPYWKDKDFTFKDLCLGSKYEIRSLYPNEKLTY